MQTKTNPNTAHLYKQPSGPQPPPKTAISQFLLPGETIFTQQDIDGFSDKPLLVTHKDAVKLRSFARENIWVVPLELTLSDDLQLKLLNLVESRLNG